MKTIFIGMKVNYYGENGIVKSIRSKDQCFVVYHCGGNWENYKNYTGVLTNIMQLSPGWKK